MRGELFNNVIVGSSAITAVRVPINGSFVGSKNWVPTGAAVASTITGTIFGAAPGFLGASYRLGPGSAAIGAADESIIGLPDREYFENEVISRMFRPRTTARDLGAFESTTIGSGIGASAAAPPTAPVDAGVQDSAILGDSSPSDARLLDVGARTDSFVEPVREPLRPGGCSVSTLRHDDRDAATWLLLAIAVAMTQRGRGSLAFCSAMYSTITSRTGREKYTR